MLRCAAVAEIKPFRVPPLRHGAGRSARGVIAPPYDVDRRRPPVEARTTRVSRAEPVQRRPPDVPDSERRGTAVSGVARAVHPRAGGLCVLGPRRTMSPGRRRAHTPRARRLVACRALRGGPSTARANAPRAQGRPARLLRATKTSSSHLPALRREGAVGTCPTGRQTSSRRYSALASSTTSALIFAMHVR